MRYTRTDALLSDCGLYRYTLTRGWDDSRGSVVFVMLNPSTADASLDDPTIRRCVGFADAWGYGRLVVVNLFAFRATDPAAMQAAADPVGTDNDSVIANIIPGHLVVCAWGATKLPRQMCNRIHRVAGILRYNEARTRHLGLTRGGYPKHPLYLPAGLTPQEFPAGHLLRCEGES